MDWIQRPDAAWESATCGALIRVACHGGQYSGYDVLSRGGRVLEWAATLDEAKRKAEAVCFVREKVKGRRAAH